MKNRADFFKVALKPLYQDLLNHSECVLDKQKYCAFCMQWGEFFPEEKNFGLLFVGRSVNGWINTELGDVDSLFGDSENIETNINPIFNLADQMEWIERPCESKKEYNTYHSPFWRVIRRVSTKYYLNNWQRHVAWSNLYKVAPSEGGNPDDFICGWQFYNCCRILKKEIELLSPRVVIFLTGKSWSNSFLWYLNGGKEPSIEYSLDWGSDYTAELMKIGTFYCLATEYPQGKTEESHVNAIIELINKTTDDVSSMKT